MQPGSTLSSCTDELPSPVLSGLTGSFSPGALSVVQAMAQHFPYVWLSFKLESLGLYSSTMTMEELLTSLQKKCRTECEEAHRQLVCALNGLAGIHIIKGKTGQLLCI